ncbi:MAG TPA: D-2-hydroxyacid dehydrogenase [Vicinamibacterales bacterium]|nr:D-2-hydroxyacid dehydrogenase [Vicinamibacterales bacterium]
MNIVVAVHDPPVWTIPAAQVQRIARALPSDEVIDARTPAERLAAFPDADVILAARMSAGEVTVARRVRWVQSTAVGVEWLAPLLSGSDVVVTNVRGVHSDTIAEHAMALVLALRRRLHTAVARQADRASAQTELQEVRNPSLAGSRLVVVGLGAIGSSVARLGRGLGMRVTGVRRRADQPVPDGIDQVYGPDGLKTALATADAVVLAAPKTAQTRAMIGAEELASMRPSAVLVNVARGRLIDDAALVAALERGTIAGAGLDAFAREPLPDSDPLWRLPNVLITPHTAPFGGDYWEQAADFFLQNLERFRRGEPLLNVVDRAGGY